MTEPYSLTIIFRPGMLPAARHEIEDELEEALGDQIEIVGGGTMVDLSESDIALDVTDLDAALAAIRTLLRGRNVSPETRIYQTAPEAMEYAVYE
jgi:hypothetical protein